MKLLLSILGVCLVLAVGFAGYSYFGAPDKTARAVQFSDTKQAAIAARAAAQKQDEMIEIEGLQNQMNAEEAARLADEKAAQAANQ